jgi:hypothetical protein
LTLVPVDPIRKEAVAKHQPFLTDDENDTLLFEKLQQNALAHYPNPERVRCPGSTILERFSKSPRDVELADLNDLHIFKCAECTRELMELRQKREQARALKDALAGQR